MKPHISINLDDKQQYLCLRKPALGTEKMSLNCPDCKSTAFDRCKCKRTERTCNTCSLKWYKCIDCGNVTKTREKTSKHLECMLGCDTKRQNAEDFDPKALKVRVSVQSFDFCFLSFSYYDCHYFWWLLLLLLLFIYLFIFIVRFDEMRILILLLICAET